MEQNIYLGSDMFNMFNNSKIIINGKEYDCDSQPDDLHRGSAVRRVFFVPDFEVKEGTNVKLNERWYIVIEAKNYNDHCEMYILNHIR